MYLSFFFRTFAGAKVFAHCNTIMTRKLFSLFVAALCCASMWATEGALSGRFTINADGDQVVFSQGNLQYQASTQTWRFARNQYDYVGDATNGNVYENDVKCNNALIANDYSGWIDLFGWGTGNDPNKIYDNPINYGTFTDWGTNNIINGGNEANLWRSLTKDEWVYLFCGRTDASQLFGMGIVNGVKGIILLPDDWTGDKFTDTENGLEARPDSYYYNENGTNFSFHAYTIELWESLMEPAGAVFLPATGGRIGIDVESDNSAGSIWSATPIRVGSAYRLFFDGFKLYPQDDTYRFPGFSVRLVQVIPANPTTIYNTDVNTKVAKRIENGQLLIEKNGKLYTTTGQEIK